MDASLNFVNDRLVDIVMDMVESRNNKQANGLASSRTGVGEAQQPQAQCK